jgi:hypothetical protein
MRRTIIVVAARGLLVNGKEQTEDWQFKRGIDGRTPFVLARDGEKQTS